MKIVIVYLWLSPLSKYLIKYIFIPLGENKSRIYREKKLEYPLYIYIKVIDTKLCKSYNRYEMQWYTSDRASLISPDFSKIFLFFFGTLFFKKYHCQSFYDVKYSLIYLDH